MKVNKLTPVLIAAFIMVITSITPFVSLINVFCCAGIFMGGFAGAFFYSRQLALDNAKPVVKDGVMIGILSGIISAVIVSGINILITLYWEGNVMDEVMKMLEEFDTALPPEFYEQANRLSAEYAQYGFSPTLAIITFIMNIILYPLFGSMGALLAISMMNKKMNISKPPDEDNVPPPAI